MIRPFHRLPILAAVTIAAAITQAARAEATIYNLGTIGGALSSSANSINASGLITGRSSFAFGTSTQHAFLYSGMPGSGAMADLGTFGGADSHAVGINDAGHVVGVAKNASGQGRAFLYAGTPGGGGAMAELGTFGGTESFGYAINGSGQIAGGARTVGGQYHAFRYTGTPGSGGTMVDLGTLGGAESFAYAINDSGHVAGRAHTAGGQYHAFLQTSVPGSMTDLGTLGGATSYAFGMNNVGQVIGAADNSAGVQRAFLYTAGAMVDLGTLPGGLSSVAYFVSDRGHVLGASTAAASRAFLYVGTPGVDGQMIDLDAWLDATNPVEGAKWTLTEARAMNESGLIVGTGIYNDGAGGLSDGTRAFVLDASALIPEPGTLALLPVVAAVIRRRRR